MTALPHSQPDTTDAAVTLEELLNQSVHMEIVVQDGTRWHFSQEQLDLARAALAAAKAALPAPVQDQGDKSGAELGRWCYENPNLAARTIEGLRSAVQDQGREALIRECADIAERYNDCGGDFIAQKIRDLELARSSTATEPAPTITYCTPSGPRWCDSDLNVLGRCGDCPLSSAQSGAPDA